MAAKGEYYIFITFIPAMKQRNKKDDGSIWKNIKICFLMWTVPLFDFKKAEEEALRMTTEAYGISLIKNF